MRALVTGADGFVGRHLVAHLTTAGWDVCAMTRRPRVPKQANIQVVPLDLLDEKTLLLSPARVGQIDVVFHLAAFMPNAQTSVEDYKRGNGAATESLIAQCIQHGIPNFIYCSSIGVIGKPQTRPITMSHPVDSQHPYFVGKLQGEQACQAASAQGLTTHIFRLTSPYGPQMPVQSVLPMFVRNALAGLPLSWHGSGSRAQDFIFIDDILSAFLAAAGTKQAGAYCLGSGLATSMKELAQTIAKLVPGTHAAPSGQDDPQEGVVWEVDASPLAQQLHVPSSLAIREGLARYIASIATPSDTWWLA